MVMQSKRAFVASSSEGKPFDVLGHLVTAKVYGSDAGGDYCAIDILPPPQG